MHDSGEAGGFLYYVMPYIEGQSLRDRLSKDGGLTPQAVLAAHLTQAPAPVTERRETIPQPLAQMIMQCLSKKPADRPQSAEALLSVLEAAATPSGGMTPMDTRPVSTPGRPIPRTWMIGAGVAAVAVVAVLLWRPWAGLGSGHRLDPNVVAVLPFRVAGADPSLQYLRQGMVDLLQTKLTGGGGPRAADARSVLAAMRDAGGTESEDLAEPALAGVARRVGAGRILQGSIVGPAEHVVLSATLLEMPGGRTVAQTSVEGPKDSLFPLVDRLTAQLLALGAGAGANQLSALTTTSLDALRVYLDGVSAYRRGNFEQSTKLLTRAVELDSTFCAGAIGTHRVGWVVRDYGRHGTGGTARLAVPRPVEPARPAVPHTPRRLPLPPRNIIAGEYRRRGESGAGDARESGCLVHARRRLLSCRGGVGCERPRGAGAQGLRAGGPA